MNIKEAKIEIQNTLRAYQRKDDRGNYLFPTVRQRPILLMGPPGIGKTAILEQIAKESGVGLVSYTLTHHTRQSAVGLPHIETVEFEGQQMSVTRYTMSEIIASIYDFMEKTGKKEGILFLDEINCVSETLAPTMLQLLQNKTFGSHKIPEGWILVTAGNPPAYNKSVREFDMATLDRVRKIDVEADCGVWLEYASAHGVHGAILSYLAIRPEQFYLAEDRAEGKFFVTARGWEDLSELLRSYEILEVPVTRELVGEYLQKQEIADGFAVYYQLYRKYNADYGIPALLDGDGREDRLAMAKNAGFEERFTVVQLLMDALDSRLALWNREQERLEALHPLLKRLKMNWNGGPGALAQSRRRSLQIQQEAGIGGETDLDRWVTETLEGYDLTLRKAHREQDGFPMLKALFGEQVSQLDAMTEALSESLRRAFRFVEEAFGEGQETVLFVTDLSRNPRAMAFITANGSEDFLHLGNCLRYRRQEEELREQCRRLLEV